MTPAPILRAGGGDVPEIRALVDAAYGKWIPLIGRKPMPMLDDYGARVAAAQVWVVRDGGALAGLVVLQDEPDHLLLENICVAPDRQGQGIGRRLLAFTEAQARARGYAEVRLYTNVRFAANIALYLRHGYAETHRAVQDGGAVQEGFERVFMTKPLA